LEFTRNCLLLSKIPNFSRFAFDRCICDHSLRLNIESLKIVKRNIIYMKEAECDSLNMNRLLLYSSGGTEHYPVEVHRGSQ